MDMYEELCKSILKVIGGRDNIESCISLCHKVAINIERFIDCWK